MSEYTKEQREDIERALRDNGCIALTDKSVAAIMHALENPKPGFQVGEVYAYSVNDGSFQYFPHHSADELRGNERHLSLTENPSTALALERLGILKSNKTLRDVHKEGTTNTSVMSAEIDAMQAYAQQAIDDIKKMVG